MIAHSIDEISTIRCFEDTPRGRVLSGAAYLFYKQGYDKTTVRQLAQFIGIQSGSLFHHFKSKDEILATVMEQTIIYHLARLKEAAAKSDQLEEKLRHLIYAELLSITGDTGAAMAVLVHEWSALSHDHQQHLLQMRQEYEQVWLNVIQALKDQGRIKHDAYVWRRLVGGAIAWTVTWYNPTGKINMNDLTDMVWDMTIR